MKNNIAQSVVLYGPKGCGKSTNAARISAALNLPRIVEIDEVLRRDQPHLELPEFGVLIITNAPERVVYNFRRLSYDHAMTAVAIHEQTQGVAA